MALKCKRRPFPIALCGIARIGGCGARNNRFAISEAGNVVPKLRAIPDAGENGQYGIDWLPRPPARTHGEIRIYRVLIDDARVRHREGVTEIKQSGADLYVAYFDNSAGIDPFRALCPSKRRPVGDRRPRRSRKTCAFRCAKARRRSARRRPTFD